MIITLLKLGLLMLSNFGYWEFFRSKWKINVCFLPAFTIAVQFMMLFVPGLLNFLGDAAWAIYLCGFLLLADALRKEKLGIFKPYWNWGYGFLVLATLLIAVAVKGKLVTWFDCFTHWAVVVKNMLAADRFPTFAQSAVGFSSYPLGSSTTIYYFCNMTSPDEDIQMLAQAFMMLCMFLPLFAYAKKNRALCAVFLALLANFLLCYNIPITELLVDTLLPLTAMAAALLLYGECLDREGEKAKLSLYYGLPLLFLTMNIKSAGMFFVLAALIPLFLVQKKSGKSLVPVVNICLILYVGNFLWNRHCDYVFAGSATSQHAVSVAYLSERFAEKTWSDVGSILKGAAQFACTRQELAWLAVWMVVLGLCTWLFADACKKRFVRLLAASAVLYVLYTVCLMGMYVFSMSVEAALELECIDRYMRTIDIAIYYLMAAYALLLIAATGKPQARLGVSLLLAALLVGTWWIPNGRFDNVTQVANDPKKRLQIKTLLDEYGVQKGYSYLICDPDSTILYSAFVCGYYLDTSQVGQIKVTEESQMEIEKRFDYVIILDEDNPVIEEWLQKTYPDQAGERVIQCFK